MTINKRAAAFAVSLSVLLTVLGVSQASAIGAFRLQGPRPNSTSQHAMIVKAKGLHVRRLGYGVHDGRSSGCYFPEEWPKLPPWPPFCN
jgi:hypothetical protein